jgi:Type IV secretion-system coupling protein DNA-binding domain
MARFPGNDLLIAHAPRGGRLTLSAKDRSMHLYVVGATGVGKSKFLEHIVRQDIRNWRKSECGLLLLDPHGAVYDGVMQWLARYSYIYDRPVIPIDLRCDDWVVAYNLLRERRAAASVITANMVDALAYVWGAGSTDATPLFARTATMVFRALYERKLTLSDALSILEHANQDFRASLASAIEDEFTRESLKRINALRPADYNAEVGSTLNRFQRLLGNNLLRATFGQPDISLDLGAALEQGHIILVSLATEGGTVSPEDADTFATLMLADLWTAAKERGKLEGVKPFYLVCDEFQRFVSPTISANLDESRGFGLHVTLAHQFPSQLVNASREHGQGLYESVMENTRTKVVFSLSLQEKNLAPLADWLFMGTYDPDQVKHELHTTKVMEYTEETHRVTTRGESRGETRSDSLGSASSTGSTRVDGSGGSFGDFSDVPQLASSWSTSQAHSSGDSRSSSQSSATSDASSESESEVPVLIPVFGQELASVQFRSIEEQQFRAQQRIMSQPDRHAIVRVRGMREPVGIRTPEVESVRRTVETVEEYRREQLAKWPFSLSYEEANQRLLDRKKTLRIATPASEPEPVSYKRPVKKPRATIKLHAGGEQEAQPKD